MKIFLLLTTPVGVVTLTRPVLVPAGTVVVKCVPECTTKLAGAPLKVTSEVPVRVIAENQHIDAFLAAEQRRIHNRRRAHVQAINGAVVGAGAANLGHAVERAVGVLNRRRQGIRV